MADDVASPFHPIERTATLSDRVTDAVLAHIERSGLRPGDRLPSERELGEQFQVSRTVVREAMRSLAAKGVLVIHSGSPATVATVDAARAGEALRLYVQGMDFGADGLTYEQINDVRSVIECRVARLAADTATEADLAELSRVHEQFSGALHDVEAASQLDLAFHRGIVVSVHNPLFLLMLDSIQPILLEIRRLTIGVPGRPRAAVVAHGLILDRIRNRDPDGAEQAMNAHLEEARIAWRDLAAAGQNPVNGRPE